MMNVFKKEIFLLLIVGVLFVACANENKRNASFLAPLNIQIPDEIKGDAALLKVVKTAEKAINEFSDNLEQLILEGEDVLNKKEEDRSLTDNLEIGRMMVQFVSNSGKMAMLIDEFDQYKAAQKKQGTLSELQLKALEEVGISFEGRMTQINNKYKDYLN